MTSLPLPLARPALPPARVDDALALRVAGEDVVLHAARALHWPRGGTLVVADVHLGKSATFRAGGVPLPRGVTAGDLERLSALVAATGATRLVVLGDFLHAKSGRVAALDATFMTWRERHAALAIVLVRGNHDDHAGDPPAAWKIEAVDAPWPLPPFLACHAPASFPTGHALCGHVHPGVRLSGRGDQSVALPCFVVGARRTVLPAFGRFTGLGRAVAEPGDCCVAIAGSKLFRLPTPPD